jgi:hypothetical protein
VHRPTSAAGRAPPPAASWSPRAPLRPSAHLGAEDDTYRTIRNNNIHTVLSQYGGGWRKDPYTEEGGRHIEEGGRPEIFANKIDIDQFRKQVLSAAKFVETPLKLRDDCLMAQNVRFYARMDEQLAAARQQPTVSKAT